MLLSKFDASNISWKQSELLFSLKHIIWIRTEALMCEWKASVTANNHNLAMKLREVVCRIKCHIFRSRRSFLVILTVCVANHSEYIDLHRSRHCYSFNHWVCLYLCVLLHIQCKRNGALSEMAPNWERMDHIMILVLAATVSLVSLFITQTRVYSDDIQEIRNIPNRHKIAYYLLHKMCNNDETLLVNIKLFEFRFKRVNLKWFLFNVFA